MPKQYKLTVSPSCTGYSDIENSPVVLAAQLSLDLANLVGQNVVYAANPILVETINKLKSAIEKSRDIGGYLDGKESAFFSATKEYINAIQNQENNENTYIKFINSLDLMTPIEEVMV